MLNYVVKCQVCGTHGPLVVRQADLPASGSPGAVERYCAVCKKDTFWTVTFPDRRVANHPQSGWRRRSTDL